MWHAHRLVDPPCLKTSKQFHAQRGLLLRHRLGKFCLQNRTVYRPLSVDCRRMSFFLPVPWHFRHFIFSLDLFDLIRRTTQIVGRVWLMS